MSTGKTWSVELAKLHYRISNWGMGFFDINTDGHVIVKAGSAELDLYALSNHLRERGIGLPVLVRLPHILQHMLSNLSTAFEQAMASCNYAGNYVAAYPIKVNQQASVIRHFDNQSEWPVAFEVGSKAELIACLGLIQKQNQTIICNGYKDEVYIRLALIGVLLGHEVIIVLESLAEFQHVLKQSAELNAQPILGMRVRLSAIAEGNWQNTGGERSKFGLTSNAVLNLVKELKQHNAIKWMQMLHFHMGSQIPSLQHIQSGIQEGMRYFAELTKLGVGFAKLNVGGGLAVDYEGSQSDSYFSMNYSINDYANSIVTNVNAICQAQDIQAPTIFSENGRAMTAYHAVLMTNVIDAEYQQENIMLDDTNLFEHPYSSNQKLKPLVDLSQQIAADIKHVNPGFDHSQSYISVMQIMKEINDDFSDGGISLEERAQVEKIARIAYAQLLRCKDNLAEEYKRDLEEKFIDKYFCNFSLFQSTPDVWGLKQIFPILPLHRLDEPPQRKVRLQDLTCDSDGQIDNYIEDSSIKSYLSLHEVRPQQDYVLGLFLVGAYQEILGDLHNLFGDTNAVNIELNPDGSYKICEEEPGDTIEEILSYVHIDATKMHQTWLDKLSQREVSAKTKELVLQELHAALKVNSYLN